MHAQLRHRRSFLKSLLFRDAFTCGTAIASAFMAGTTVTELRAQSAAASRYETIVQSGDASPDTGVSYSSFSRPVLGRTDLAFESSLSGAVTSGDDQAIVRWKLFHPDGPQYSDRATGFLREGYDLGGRVSLSMQLGPSSRQLSITDDATIGFNCGLAGTGGTNNDTGLYVYDYQEYVFGGTLTELAREGAAAPGGEGTLQNFGTGILDVQFRGINDAGHTFFQDVITDSPGAPADDWRFFEAGPGSVMARAVEGQPAPLGGNFSAFSGYEMNDIGEAIVTGSTATANIGNKIWYMDSSGSLTEVVHSVVTGGTNTPVGAIRSLSSGMSMINNAGDIAFVGWTSAGGTGTSDSFLFRTDRTGAAVQVMLAEGTAAPDGNGVFDNIVNTTARYNDAGQYASGFSLRGTSGGTADNTGIYRVDADGAVTRLFREGQASLSGNGAFGDLSGATQFAFNKHGVAAMMTNYTGTAGGASDNTAIVVTDGIDYFEVAREGVAVNGSTVASLDFSNGVFGNDVTTSGLNEFGQVAYVQRLANNTQSIQLWTPELHYRGGDGQFSDGANWTLSTSPNFVHDVYVDPDVDSVVSFGSQFVRSLHVGGGLGSATLQSTVAGIPLLRVYGSTVLYSNGSIENSVGALQLTTEELHGTGSILAADFVSVDVYDLLSPGFSVGRLEIQGQLGLHGDTLLELGGTFLGEYDQVYGLEGPGPTSAALVLDPDAQLHVSLFGGFLLDDGMEFTIFDIADPLGTIYGEFRLLPEASLVGNFGGHDLFITYAGGDGNDIVLYTSAIPEPATGILFAIFIVLASVNRRKRAKSVLC